MSDELDWKSGCSAIEREELGAFGGRNATLEEGAPRQEKNKGADGMSLVVDLEEPSAPHNLLYAFLNSLRTVPQVFVMA